MGRLPVERYRNIFILIFIVFYMLHKLNYKKQLNKFFTISIYTYYTHRDGEKRKKNVLVSIMVCTVLLNSEHALKRIETSLGEWVTLISMDTLGLHEYVAYI